MMENFSQSHRCPLRLLILRIECPSHRELSRLAVFTTGIYAMAELFQSERRRNKDKVKGGMLSNRSQGFTLIEILVAISILAISLVVILQLFSGALKSSRVSDEYTRGLFYAQEKMEQILLNDELKTGPQEGEFDEAYQWRVEIDRLAQTEEESKKLSFDTLQITLDVSWDKGGEGKGKNIQLSSMKLVKKEENSQNESPEGIEEKK